AQTNHKVRKKDVRLQFDHENRVEFFKHLPQYNKHGISFESKFLQLVHPAVYKVGLQYRCGDISDDNACSIAMLESFQEAIKDYNCCSNKDLAWDLPTKIASYVSFLTECRPLSISMVNAIEFLKARNKEKLTLDLSESEAKTSLISFIQRFIDEKILVPEKAILEHGIANIVDDDVVLTFGTSSSSAVETILVHAHELGKVQFRVVIVDSRPELQGQRLLRRLVEKGISCTYTHVSAVAYVMRGVTKVIMGACSVFSNGAVYSRVGTACVAMVAHQLRVPVLVCCEAYKFHERAQLSSICFNQLGDPDAVSRVSGRKKINSLDGWADTENLRPLNLVYDTTPADYVSMIITDCGLVI
ncbi:translation initiation factor eif-2b subunit delta, partial [Phtheirospermum japonicum]